MQERHSVLTSDVGQASEVEIRMKGWYCVGTPERSSKPNMSSFFTSILFEVVSASPFARTLLLFVPDWLPIRAGLN